VDNKRYQVFVSSTYQDLTDERAAVIQAILNLDHLPAGMEMFPAANADQMTLIKRVIDESDYYVVVVAGHYGSVDAKGISYTEQEYDYAVEREKPILGFVHGEPAKIEVGKTDQSDAARQKLAEFRAKVESRMVKHFTSPAELGGHVTTSLVHAIKNDPGIGWVRGDQAMTIETERELIDLRERLVKAEKEREQAQQAMVEDVASLAQGKDEVRIPVRITKSRPKVSTVTHDVVTTWDELFADIGPKMVGEATTRRLMAEVGLHLASRDPEVNPEEITNDALVAVEDWEKIQLQYQALGLVELGKRRRLRLTERGERHLIHLRAIRRDDPTQTN
jgi:hypothetical protein